MIRDRRERISLKKALAEASAFLMVEARQSKPDTPSCDKETSLHLISRYLAARPSGLVETRGVELTTLFQIISQNTHFTNK